MGSCQSHQNQTVSQSVTNNDYKTKNLNEWNDADVYHYLSTTRDGECKSMAKHFKKHKINGQKFQQIKDDDLVDMKMNVAHKQQFKAARVNAFNQYDNILKRNTEICTEPIINADTDYNTSDDESVMYEDSIDRISFFSHISNTSIAVAERSIDKEESPSTKQDLNIVSAQLKALVPDVIITDSGDKKEIVGSHKKGNCFRKSSHNIHGNHSQNTTNANPNDSNSGNNHNKNDNDNNNHNDQNNNDNDKNEINFNVNRMSHKENKKATNNKISINKRLTMRTLREIIKETFVDPHGYMMCFSVLYPEQVMNVYQNGAIGIANYNIHCNKTGELLYVMCEQQDSDKFKQNNALYTAAELQQKYNIKSEELPQVSHIPSDLTPQASEMTAIHKILKDKNKRSQIIRSAKWCNRNKIPIHKVNNVNKSSSLTFQITQEEFIKKLHEFADNMQYAVMDDPEEMEEKCYNDVDLIPIVKFKDDMHWIEYVWIIYMEFSSKIKFNLGISLKLLRKQSKPIEISGIYLNCYDQHKLVQSAHTTSQCKICLDEYISYINDLEIGNGKVHRINQLEQNIKELKHNIDSLKQQLQLQDKQSNDNHDASQVVIKALRQQLQAILHQNQILTDYIHDLATSQPEYQPTAKHQ